MVLGIEERPKMSSDTRSMTWDYDVSSSDAASLYRAACLGSVEGSA